MKEPHLPLQYAKLSADHKKTVDELLKDAYPFPWDVIGSAGPNGQDRTTELADLEIVFDYYKKQKEKRVALPGSP